MARCFPNISERARGVMDAVIILSSDSEEDDSDVELIPQDVNSLSRTDPLHPVNPPQESIKTTGSEPVLPDLKPPAKPDFTAIPIIDLTDFDAEIEDSESELQEIFGPIEEEEKTSERSPLADSPRTNASSTLNESRELQAAQACAEPQAQADEARSPFVRLTRLPFIENYVTELTRLSCFVYTIKGRTYMSLQPRQHDASSEEVLSDSFISTEHRTDASATPDRLSGSDQRAPTPTCEHALSGRSSEDMKVVAPTETSGEDVLDQEDPVCFYPQAWEFEDGLSDGCTFHVDLRTEAGDDRDFVCPVALTKLLSGGQDETLLMDITLDEEAFGPPEELCYQTLTLVYSTIEENHTEGTLQLLSDLLQPGYYPPKDITFHLLHHILLGPDCPYHLRMQAFHLLIRTQRHHPVDTNTVPWDWDLLTSVINEEHPNKHKFEVVRMLLEYVLRTLEDDFHAKRAASDLHHSMCRATLSCDRQFPHVRDLLKWLFSTIMKSTEGEESKNTARERDEHIRLVSIFQRMLALALEVERIPTLHSLKLSQELFHMLVSSSFRRRHRMLLLESLQSKLLRCKLLELMLGYRCPVESPKPMSLSLLLHFMSNCVLLPDPTDGPERWRSWEELVHLLWMALHSYNKTMKGYLSQPFREGRSHLGPFKEDDIISKSNVCEAAKTLLERAQADLGQALPHHVEESLHFLRENLLDVCDYVDSRDSHVE